ncbi:MAG TPA: hypothetical protein VGG44_11010 [Tepidisphaeraceae bacterium]|jgi:hypothetical protein
MNRWLKFFLIALAIAIAWCMAIIVVMNTGDQRTDYYRWPYLEALLYPVIVMGILGVVGAVMARFKWANDIQQGINELRRREIPEANITPMPPGFPVIEVIPEYSPPTDGPGKYRIEGVDRKTEKDATLHIEADSAANAKVKAELHGIVVTAVVKEL